MRVDRNNCRPTEEKSFLAFIEQSVQKNWNQDAMTDYRGETMTYGEVALRIAKLHLLFEKVGIRKGDKIALCGRNCSH